MVPATMIHLTVRPGRVTTQRHFELPKRGRTLTAGARRIADSARLIFLRRGLTAWYRMCGSARDGVAVAAYAQGLSGRDGVSLAGAGELAAEPAVLVQAAAGGLDPPRLGHPADPYGVKPADRDDPSIAANARLSSLA